MVVGGVPILKKTQIALVRLADAQGMLDWAPILFGAAGNLASISDDAVGITAIGTVQRLEPVEVGQMMTVENDIIRPLDLRDGNCPPTPWGSGGKAVNGW